MPETDDLDLYQELLAICRSLDERGIDHALAGALALAVHGVVRATVDIDLLIRPEDLDSAIAVGKEQGFLIEALPMKLGGELEVRRLTKLAGAESLTLDFLLVGEALRPAWEGRSQFVTEHGALTVVSREALIQMKARAGREQDHADIRRLQELDG